MAERKKRYANIPVGKWACSQCGTVGKAKTITKGSILVELAAWVFGLAFCWFFLIFLLVPIAYSIWRHLSWHKGCPSRHGPMIKIDTPIGKQLLDKVG